MPSGRSCAPSRSAAAPRPASAWWRWPRRRAAWRCWSATWATPRRWRSRPRRWRRVGDGARRRSRTPSACCGCTRASSTRRRERFAHARDLCRREQDRLGEFRALEHLAALEWRASAATRCAGSSEELVEIGERLGEGSEAPYARALRGAVRGMPRPPAAADELEAALAELRIVDAKQRLDARARWPPPRPTWIAGRAAAARARAGRRWTLSRAARAPQRHRAGARRPGARRQPARRRRGGPSAARAARPGRCARRRRRRAPRRRRSRRRRPRPPTEGGEMAPSYWSANSIPPCASTTWRRWRRRRRGAWSSTASITPQPVVVRRSRVAVRVRGAGCRGGPPASCSSSTCRSAPPGRRPSIRRPAEAADGAARRRPPRAIVVVERAFAEAGRVRRGAGARGRRGAGAWSSTASASCAPTSRSTGAACSASTRRPTPRRCAPSSARSACRTSGCGTPSSGRPARRALAQQRWRAPLPRRRVTTLRRRGRAGARPSSAARRQSRQDHSRARRARRGQGRGRGGRPAPCTRGRQGSGA